MWNLLYMIVIILLISFILFSIFNKKAKRRVKALSIWGAVAAIIAAVYLWFNPSFTLPQTTGEHEVARAEAILVDEGRIETYRDDGSYRWLSVGFWYPENYSGADNTCPLIVFSHGAFGVKESNESLYRELASHGYVVCAIDHTYQNQSAVGADGKKVGMDGAYLKQVLGAGDDDENKREELAKTFAQWMKIRMDDISFVLDAILYPADIDSDALNTAHLLADETKIGVMGHSLGGAAALGIGRVRDDVGAVISLEAPFMYDVQGISEGDFVWNTSAYTVPVLNVYSESSWHILNSSPQYAQNHAFLKDSSDTTYDIYAKGAGHMTLTDLALSSPPLCLLFGQDIFLKTDEFTQKLNQNYLKFFDCYLKGDKNYSPVVF